MSSTKATTAATLSLLEERLQRLDYVLNGNSGPAEEEPQQQQQQQQQQDQYLSRGAAARLRALERGLQALVSKSPAATEVLALQKERPDLFDHASIDTPPTALPLSSLAALVLAHSALYQSTASRLSMIQDAALPDSTAMTKLVDQRVRIERARAKQELQTKEFADLRAKSARALESWYEDGVLEMGEHWAEWEERLKEIEILVRRREAAKTREESGV